MNGASSIGPMIADAEDVERLGLLDGFGAEPVAIATIWLSLPWLRRNRVGYGTSVGRQSQFIYAEFRKVAISIEIFLTSSL